MDRREHRGRFGFVAALALCGGLLGCTDTGGPNVRIVPESGPQQPHYAAFSPTDGARLLVVEGSGRVGIWRMQPPLAPAILASITAGAQDAAFAPDGGTVVTSGFDGRVRRWTTEGRLVWTTKEGHVGDVRAVAMAEKLIVSGGDDGVVRLWTPDGASAGEPLTGHAMPILSIAVSQRGDIVSAGSDGSVRLWKRAPGDVPKYQEKILFRINNPPSANNVEGKLRFEPSWAWRHSVGFSPGGDTVATSILEDTTRLWDADGSPRGELARPYVNAEVRALAFSPGGPHLATAGLDHKVRLWTADGLWGGNPIDAHPKGVYSVSFSNDGARLITTGGDGTVRQWGLQGASGGELPASNPFPVAGLAVSPIEPTIAFANPEGEVRVVSLDGAKEPKVIIGERKVTALVFSSRGDSIAIGDKEGGVQVRGLDGSETGASLPVDGAPARSVAFSPGDRSIAAAGRTLRVLTDGNIVQQPAVSFDVFTAVAFSPNGDTIAGGSLLGRVHGWSAGGQPSHEPVKLPFENVRSIAFVQRGEGYATVGGYEHVIRVWRLDGSAIDPPLEGHLEPVTSLASNADASLLASGSMDGTVRLWKLPERQVEVVDVGLRVDQVGFWRGALWVRAGDTLLFYDRAQPRRLFATALLKPNGALTYTSGGWYTGPGPLRAFEESGKRLSVSQTGARVSPRRVRAAFEHAVE